MKGIGKSFSGVVALDGIDFDLMPGEVHVVLGENGAGKSTLMKILSGAYTPSCGTMEIQGVAHASMTPASSAHAGIAIIYQELSVIHQLSIAENLFLGRLPGRSVFGVGMVDRKAMNAEAAGAIARVGLNRSPEEFVRDLSISERQLVEIARALTSKARVIIMDEPTSSLTIEETGKLFTIIKALKADGVGIIYISHKLEEISRIADRVTVLKDGRLVGTRAASSLDVDQMIAMMVGRELDRKTRLEPAVKRENPQTIFEVRDLSRRDGKVEHVGFELKEGEILGFSGLMGSGRTELMEAIFGVVPVKGGEIWLNGKRLTHRSTYGALRNRIAFITEDRRDTGFFSNFSILQNLAISKELLDSRLGGLWGRVDLKRDRTLALEQREALSIKCSSVDQSITELSGGNQQKVLIGKWLATEPAVVIFDEPTKGIDVGSKAEIYRIMRRLADEGKGVIMVSSELPELLFICDRIVVFSQGKKTAELPAATATEESIMRAATRTFQHV